MKNHLFPLISLLAALLLMVGCNSLKPDELPDPDIQNDLELYTAFDEGEVIDLAEGLNAGQTATISLVEGPVHGTFELAGENLAVYEPANTGVAYNDSLTLNYRIGSKDYLRKLRFLVRPAQQIPNYLGVARFDRGGIVARNESVLIDILANDLIPGGVQVTRLAVLLQGEKGIARITTNNKLEYLAGSTLTGFDRVIYGVLLSDGRKGIAQVRFFVD